MYNDGSMMDFFKYIQWKERIEQRLEPYYHIKVNKRLKYAIWISLGILMILLVLQSFLDPYDYRDYKPYMLLQGFSGVFGWIVFILTGILVYRVNAEYFKDRWKPASKSE